MGRSTAYVITLRMADPCFETNRPAVLKVRLTPQNPRRRREGDGCWSAQPDVGVCRKHCQLRLKEEGIEEMGTPCALPMPGRAWRGARPRPKRSWKTETHWVR